MMEKFSRINDSLSSSNLYLERFKEAFDGAVVSISAEKYFNVPFTLSKISKEFRVMAFSILGYTVNGNLVDIYVEGIFRGGVCVMGVIRVGQGTENLLLDFNPMMDMYDSIRGMIAKIKIHTNLLLEE